MSIFDINSENIKLTVLEKEDDELIDNNFYFEIIVNKAFLNKSLINLALYHATEKKSNIRFTERENEILKYLAQGKNNTEIGKIMYLSPYTIKVHVHNIFNKLVSFDRTDAVVKAIKYNLLDVDEIPFVTHEWGN
jgi:DNA-binding NarL/FixJ family response regulator